MRPARRAVEVWNLQQRQIMKLLLIRLWEDWILTNGRQKQSFTTSNTLLCINLYFIRILLCFISKNTNVVQTIQKNDTANQFLLLAASYFSYLELHCLSSFPLLSQAPHFSLRDVSMPFLTKKKFQSIS